MLSVGDLFPSFTLKGINENNEFVDVEVNEGYILCKRIGL